MDNKIWVWGKSAVGVIVAIIFCLLCVRSILLENRMTNMQTRLDDMQIQSDNQSHALLVLEHVVKQEQKEIDILIDIVVIQAPVQPRINTVSP